MVGFSHNFDHQGQLGTKSEKQIVHNKIIYHAALG